MPKMDIRPFKATNNADILNAIRHDASSDYQNRIPESTKSNVQENLKLLIEFRPQWNEFVDALINRIGLVIVKNNIWTNPLAKFKRGMMEYGDTIEEINVGLIKSHVYNSNRENLERDIFGNYPPEVQSSFHKVNRMEYYPITVNTPLLQRAFLDNSGLSSFVTSVLSAPTTSDQWDEFLLMCSLFREYYENEGFFKVNVPDVSVSTSTGDDAKQFLRRVRELSNTLKFLSTHYNAAGMPVAVEPDELELFITPEALAAIDVEALSAAFNIDKANMPARITVIPKENFNIPGAQAILSTKDFFVIADNRIETASQFNPVSLNNNYFLHHWEVVSASRFIPAILFTTEPGDVINVPDTPVTAISALSVVDEAQNVITNAVRGQFYQLIGSAVTTPAGGENDDIRLEVTGAISSHTFIAQTGVLYIGIDEDSTSIVIHAYAVDDGTITATTTVGIVGDKLNLWPDPSVDPDADSDGIFDLTPDTLTMATNGNVVIPEQDGALFKKQITVGVAFTDAGDLVTIPKHQLNVGDAVVFGTITTTTGIVVGTKYFVKSVVDANTVTLSATLGGAILVLTTNGTAASVTAELRQGSTHNVATGSTIVFTAVPLTGWEAAPGATASWTFTR